MNRTPVETRRWRVLAAIGIGTASSLLGDSALYAVLPTHTAAAGVTLASVGVLLSANRWIRLVLNNVAGVAYDRWPRRWFFLPALFLGALSTALYAFTQGFWPLLVGRLLWGVAWSGIWVGGNTIVLDVTTSDDRGRLTGLYQLSFYLGSTLGSSLGGVLTDGLGYHRALTVAAGLMLLGALIALVLLPETRGWQPAHPIVIAPSSPSTPSRAFSLHDPVISATLLYTVNRFVIAGVMISTLGLLIQQRWGEVRFAGGAALGVATLTGLLLSASTVISLITAPAAGHWSDRAGSRWRVTVWTLVPGLMGMGLLALGAPLAIVPGVLLSAIAGGSNQSLATAVLGDAAGERRGRALGGMHTFGDLGSAIAPPLAYAMLPWTGLAGVYALCVALLAGMWLWAMRLARTVAPEDEGDTIPHWNKVTASEAKQSPLRRLLRRLSLRGTPLGDRAAARNDNASRSQREIHSDEAD